MSFATFHRLALCASFALALPAWAQSQQAANPEQMRQAMQSAMKASMEAMVGAMGPMADAMIESQTAAAAKPEIAERVAAFKKNLFDALVKKGFTPEQALSLVVATAPPNASFSSK